MFQVENYQGKTHEKILANLIQLASLDLESTLLKVTQSTLDYIATHLCMKSVYCLFTLHIYEMHIILLYLFRNIKPI